MMNSNLNYLGAKHRTADLMRAAEQARLARDARAVRSAAGTVGWGGRFLSRLRAAGPTVTPVEHRRQVAEREPRPAPSNVSQVGARSCAESPTR
jgi:hypothetical protein